MNLFTAAIIAMIIILSMTGLATWARFALDRVEKELEALEDFQGLHLDI